MRCLALRSLAVGFALTSSPAYASEWPCTSDARLTAVAAELVLDAVVPDEARIVEALADVGSDRPTAHVLVEPVGNDDRAIVRWLDALASRERAAIVCGTAEDGDRRIVVAASCAGRLDVDPSMTRIRPWVASSERDAYLVVEAADGWSARVVVDDGVLRRGLALDPVLSRPIRVQLVATGRDGPRPIAHARLGEGAPSSIDPPSTATSLDAGIDDLRARSRARPLRRNRLLAEAAASHAADVCRDGRIAHVRDGDPTDRLRRRGVEARHVGEAIARARDLPAALAAIEESPSHRLAVADRRMTDQGAGVARDHAGRTCVVVLVASWPRFVGR